MASEGLRRGRILRNSPPRPKRAVGVGQMSIVAAPWGAGSCDPRLRAARFLANSFPSFTGLCEKERQDPLHFALRGSSQMIVVQKEWNDCACAL
jgi:hypothetical protein